MGPVIWPKLGGQAGLDAAELRPVEWIEEVGAVLELERDALVLAEAGALMMAMFSCSRSVAESCRGSAKVAPNWNWPGW